MAIERVEVYLNDSAEPLQVLTQAPYKISFDTRSLPDGEHSLKVVTHYNNGTQDIKHTDFKVSNTPGVLLQGLEDGKEVSGNLDVTLRVADNNIQPQREKFPGAVFVAITGVLLLGIWGFFAINPGLTKEAIKEVAGKPAKAGEAHGGEAAAAGPVDAALLKEGEGLYTQNCAGCHQATGTGLPGAFPALAGDANLADAKLIVSAVHKGKNTMPAVGAAFSDQQLAAVATYVRNSWGNNFGGVSAEQAAEYK